MVANTNLRLSFRNALDRVDIMGYGPTHPRVAVVVTGDVPEDLVSTVESVFAHTDMNRIFSVVVVVDGMAKNTKLIRDLVKIHDGTIPHLHGARPDLHDAATAAAEAEEEEDAHDKKVHVLFNPERRGVTECRQDAVDFVTILQKYHEQAGLKSTQEDLILLLLQQGAQLSSRKWLPPVTEALIVPPPILASHGGSAGLGDVESQDFIAMKLANAVAFNMEGPGKRTSFDAYFAKIDNDDATADELNASNGASYATPAWNGAALALRLETYMNLPIHDVALTHEWTANLDLSLALWMCADGIDMLSGPDVEVTVFQPSGGRSKAGSAAQELPATEALPPALAARFAAAWMDDVTLKKFFNYYTTAANAPYKNQVTFLEWQTYVAQARHGATFTKDLPKKCRSLAWYAENVNTNLRPILQQQVDTTVSDTARDLDASPPAGDTEGADKKLPDSPLEPPIVVDENTTRGGAAAVAGGGGGGDNAAAIPERHEQAKPSKPLCKECLEIVQKAKPMDISFVDVSGGHLEHPHMGALDVVGLHYGYIHDETALRLQNPPPAMQVTPDEMTTMCKTRDNNYKMLTEKVFVDLKAHAQADIDLGGKDKRAKIFCLVYTISPNHAGLHRIRETWGPKCDGFMVGSNQTDRSLGTVYIPHEGEEAYNNIWQKVRSMWAYIYDNYYEKYDWFHIGGDDLYLIVENLRLYLESEEIRTASNGGIYLPDGTETMQTPLFLGRRFAYQGDMNDIFNSGGSGYTLNKAALKSIVVEGLPKIFPHAHTFSEDTMIARVLRQGFGVYPYETKDETGGERYMPFMPGHHYGYRMPADPSQDWYARYSINIKTGLDHCAARSVAFHYVKGTSMYRLHALLYHLCPDDPYVPVAAIAAR
jgi:glycoprotein-N-acetylgalactosamine 3-beta-galactosyltransferase